MVPEKSLVIYKNRPALVSGRESEKINISVIQGETVKVREKDIELLHSGPCSPKDLEGTAPEGNVREAWELLADDISAKPIPLKELAELIYNDFSPRCAWAAWELLKEGLYFSGSPSAIKARPRAVVEEDERKHEEKQRETGERAAFLEKMNKLLKGALSPGELSAADRRFLQDVEALAWGQTDKSRTLKELATSETPEEAHRLLLACGAWTIWDNPHPERFRLDKNSSRISLPPPPMGERLDLTHLSSYAIDNAWSCDPDDAISLEGPDGGGHCCLWVHVADPASSVLPDSTADLEARARGATLYLPEGPSRMLCPDSLPFFALGLQETSPALSFKITLKPDSTIREIEIFPSLVKVTRLTYQEADALIASGDKTLIALFHLTERNLERRLDNGAVLIDMPEVHIKVNTEENNRSISVVPIEEYRSGSIVRECMVLAGEGAARWALHRQLPFPFISQEAGELPMERLPGLAGAWQLRRSMKPRNLSSKPGVHWGLGLDEYTQVTSPLRRYTDLLCHQQIRAFIEGKKHLDSEEILFRLMAGEAAASAALRAERASLAHWKAVYLSDKKDSVWDGIILDRKGSKATVLIPALGIETQLSLRGKEQANEKVKLILLSAKIPEANIILSVY